VVVADAADGVGDPGSLDETDAAPSEDEPRVHATKTTLIPSARYRGKRRVTVRV